MKYEFILFVMKSYFKEIQLRSLFCFFSIFTQLITLWYYKTERFSYFLRVLIENLTDLNIIFTVQITGLLDLWLSEYYCVITAFTPFFLFFISFHIYYFINTALYIYEHRARQEALILLCISTFFYFVFFNKKRFSDCIISFVSLYDHQQYIMPVIFNFRITEWTYIVFKFSIYNIIIILFFFRNAFLLNQKLGSLNHFIRKLIYYFYAIVFIRVSSNFKIFFFFVSFIFVYQEFTFFRSLYYTFYKTSLPMHFIIF